MRVTVFTRNQPRHLSFIAELARIADEVFAVQECNTVFPGQVEDFFRKSSVMQAYFSRVIAAELQVFGDIGFSPSNVRGLAIKGGDLGRLENGILADALRSDVYVVFGASYIKGPLANFLVERRALNIHMGVSPYYRGSSCNFWALYDGNPGLVGATIHLLTRGLDSGPILFHALPKPQEVDPFVFGMRAVKAAHRSLIEALISKQLLSRPGVVQDKSQQLRYTRNADFTDDVAEAYLAKYLSPADLGRLLDEGPSWALLDPRYH